MTDILKAALAYAKRGWRIIPLRAGTKVSHKSERYSGSKWGATSNPVEIARDFRRWPDAGIGLATGAASGVLALDVDTLESHHAVDGVGNLAKLEAEYGKLSDTLEGRSASGGRHLYFAWPDDGLDVPSSNGKIAPGIDVQASNNIIVLPPTHMLNGEYRWINDLPLALLPARWLGLLRRENHRVNGDGGAEIEYPEGGEPAAGIDLDEIEFGMVELPNETIEGATNETHPRCFELDDWLAVCMSLHHTFGGSPRGCAIFVRWSAKNPEKHNVKKDTVKTWASFNSNPVRKYKPGTIIRYLNRACPGWRERYAAVVAEKQAADAESVDAEIIAEIAASRAAEGKSMESITAEIDRQGNTGSNSPGVDRSASADEAPAAAAQPSAKSEEPSGAGDGAATDGTPPQGDAPVEMRIAGLNERHALVLTGGSNAAVMKFEADGKTFRLIGIEAFKTWHLNNPIKTTVDGKSKWTTIGEHWLRNSRRRQYEGIEFAPAGGRRGYFNLWRGFSVEPRPGDCGKFLAHVRDNVAQGDESLNQWIIGWFAQIAQQPDKKLGTALALRGKPGVGKTIVGETFGSLFRGHYALVADPRYVTGQFNSHMASLLLLHADEAFWAGDKRSEGKLKDLVTGHTHFLEYKRVDPIEVRNLIRLFATGNADWLVPAAFRERRWAVVDVGDDHIQDIAYFAAIGEEMDNGGREALLHHLLDFKLETVNLRVIPQTAALLEQKIASASAEERFWLDTLKSGRLPGASEAAPDTCVKHRLYEAYIRHAGRTGQSHRAIEVKIGMFLWRYVGPDLASDKVTYHVYTRRGDKITKRGPAYRFPSLADCRLRFAKEINQEVPWGGDAAVWEADEVVEVEEVIEKTFG